MNPILDAAFKLQIHDLKRRPLSKENIGGTLLAACSALPLDIQDKKSKSTALHRAVIGTGAPKTKGKAEEDRKIIEALLNAGADPAIRNKLGKYPEAYVKDSEIKAKFKTAKGTAALKAKNMDYHG